MGFGLDLPGAWVRLTMPLIQAIRKRLWSRDENATSSQSVGGARPGYAACNLPAVGAAGAGGIVRGHDSGAFGVAGRDVIVPFEGARERRHGGITPGWAIRFLLRQLRSDEWLAGIPDGELLSGPQLHDRIRTAATSQAQTRLALHFSFPMPEFLCCWGAGKGARP